MADFVWPAPPPPVLLAALFASLHGDMQVVSGRAAVPTSNQLISAIVYDSRKVVPGTLFVAVPGFHVDGFHYVKPAIEGGAAAVVVGAERESELRKLAEDYPQIVFAVVPDVRIALAHIAARFYDYPGYKMKVIGVTGTDGKTTTTFLTSAILEAAGYKTGLIGTVAFKVGSQWWDNPTRQTTLEAVETQALLAEMLRQGVDYALIESSSHALALHKLLDVGYRAAALTNVTSEHLDFHGTVEEYRRAKSLLFGALGPAYMAINSIEAAPYTPAAIVNRDDPHAGLFLDAASVNDSPPKRQVYTYGIGTSSTLPVPETTVALTATDIQANAQSTAYTLRVSGGKSSEKAEDMAQQSRITLRLPGEFNVYNSMAAACIGLSQGVELETIAKGLAAVTGVPGRMETIAEGQPFAVIVDYAHTAESLAKVLRILRPLTPGRVIVLFGSAGERDRVKRPVMGKVAAELADMAIFTNEDPRLEDEMAILREIAAGATEAGWQDNERFWLIPDRHAAIAHAFRLAQPGDTVLLAGKGHEQSIIIGTQKTPYDERDAARDALHVMGYGA